MIDVSNLPKTIQISDDRKYMTISCGFRLGQVTDELAKQKLIIPTGQCWCVGIYGISLMGGKTPLSRLYGTMSDNIVEAKVVDYKGDILTVNKDENSDLFWAIKGFTLSISCPVFIKSKGS